MVSLDDVTVVIQGPTNNYKNILNNMNPNLRYIWSTWDDEPTHNLKEIESKAQIVLSKKFVNCGLRNINYQCHTSEMGIRASQTPWVIKTRGDLLWTGEETLIKKTFSDLIEKKSFASFLSYKPKINEVHDFVSFSSKENGFLLWSYRQNQPNYKSPEHQLCDHMCSILDTNYEQLIKNLSFFNIFMEKNIVDIYCIKYDVSLGEQCNMDWGGIEQFPKKI